VGIPWVIYWWFGNRGTTTVCKSIAASDFLKMCLLFETTFLGRMLGIHHFSYVMVGAEFSCSRQ